MANGINKVILVGNLGQDPELKMIAGGQSVMNLRIATTETWYDKDNQKKERTDWHSVAIWGKRAEGLAKFLRKGAQVYVEGRIQTRTYEKNGEKRYATDIQAHELLVLGGRSDGATDGSSRATPPRGASDAAANAGGAAGPGNDFGEDFAGDDEIPF